MCSERCGWVPLREVDLHASLPRGKARKLPDKPSRTRISLPDLESVAVQMTGSSYPGGARAGKCR